MIRFSQTKKSYITSFLLTLGMFFSVFVYAAEPQSSLSFQGQLFDNNVPVNTTLPATFTFYDSLTNGSSTGSVITKTISVANGYFSTTFSPSDTTGVNFNQQLYLEVTVNGTTLSPRTTITPTVSSQKTIGTFSYAISPTVGPVGSLYFNTTTNELYVSNGSIWQLSGTASSTTQWMPNGTSLNYMAGNVGIGTTNPTSLLDVISSSSPIIAQFQNATSDAAAIRINNSGVDGMLEMGVRPDATSYIATGGAVAKPLSFLASSFSFEGGNVGVGTSNPGVTFEVNKDLGTSTGQRELIKIINNGIAGIGLGYRADGTSAIGGYIRSTGSLPLFIETSGAPQAMTLLNSGHFGIGTTTPSARLSVIGFGGTTQATFRTANSSNVPTFTILDNGTASFSGLVGIGTTTPEYNLDINGVMAVRAFQNTSASGGFLRLMFARGASNAAPLAVQSADRLSAVVSQGYDGTSFLSSATIETWVDGTVATGSIPTSMRFFTTPIGGGSRLERFRINNAGFMGIGVIDPDSKLTIIASSTTFANQFTLRSARAALVNGDILGSVDFASNDTNLGSLGSTTASIVALANTTHTTSALGTDLSFRVTNGATTSEALRILGNGNVGIGTTSPATLLHVGGAILAPLPAFPGTVARFVNSSQAPGGIEVYASQANISVDARILFAANDGSYITMGQPSASNTATLFGLPRSTMSFIFNNAGTAGGATRDMAIGTFDAKDLIFGTTNAERMRILANGNVGIGTTTPSATFTASGTIRFINLGSGGAGLVTDSLGNVTVSSDERLKDIQGVYESGLAQLKNINPISYKWKTETGYDTQNTYAGFSAQNVQANIPEAVTTDSRGFLTLADRPILATLVNAVKEVGVMLEGFKDKFTTKELCLEDVCITKDQLRVLLQNSNQQSNTSSAPAPAPDPVSTSTDPVAPDEDTEEEVVPPATPDPAPVADTPPTQ